MDHMLSKDFMRLEAFYSEIRIQQVALQYSPHLIEVSVIKEARLHKFAMLSLSLMKAIE